MSQKVNLNAYFERIGFAGSIAPTLATLETIAALHPAAIPFENLSPLLGWPVNLDLPSLEKKLLSERRGGYCYEHNLLLMAMLRDLDYTVRCLAARVLWSDPDASDAPASHMLLAVDISGTTYIVDPGFGGMALTAPLKLRADVEQNTPHETFRLLQNGSDWRLEARIGDDWRPLYVFTTQERQLSDYEEMNAIASTAPDSAFTRALRVSLAPQGKRLTLRGNRLTTHRVGAPSESRVLNSVAELREALSGVFGIQLPAAERLDPKLEMVLADAGGVEV